MILTTWHPHWVFIPITVFLISVLPVHEHGRSLIHFPLSFYIVVRLIISCFSQLYCSWWDDSVGRGHFHKAWWPDFYSLDSCRGKARTNCCELSSGLHLHSVVHKKPLTEWDPLLWDFNLVRSLLIQRKETDFSASIMHSAILWRCLLGIRIFQMSL